MVNVKIVTIILYLSLYSVHYASHTHTRNACIYNYVHAPDMLDGDVNRRKLLLHIDGVANLFVEEAAVKDDAGVVMVKLDDVIQVLGLL